MKILEAIRTVDPLSGGPAEGLAQSSRAIAQMGHTIDVVSLDGPGAACLKDFPATVYALGPCLGKYGYTPRLVPWLVHNAPRYDALIVDGLWQFTGPAVRTAARKTGVPYFVYAHGMLSPWFKKNYPLKHAKKWLYWPWAEYRVLRDAAAVLFASQDELSAARQSFGLYKCNEALAGYGTSLPPQDKDRKIRLFHDAFPGLKNKKIILFFGRITEKKGVDILIEAFARVFGYDDDRHLVLAGPYETRYRRRLDKLAGRLGIGARISWPGPMTDEHKWTAFHAAEAFALFSHQESFGVSLAEALGCGLPVLISDKIDTCRRVSAYNAGLVCADTVGDAASALSAWKRLSRDEKKAMSENAKRCFEYFDVTASSEKLIDIISSTLKGRYPRYA